MSKKWVQLKDWVSSFGVDYPPGKQEMPEDAAKSVVAKGLGEYVQDGENSDFKPLSFEETFKRFDEGDSSDEVYQSLKFYQPVIAEAKSSGKTVQELLEAKSAGNNSEKEAGESGNKGKAEAGLPEDLPMKHILEKPNKHSETGFNSVAEVQALTREKLIEIDGIADKTADKILAYGKGGE